MRKASHGQRAAPAWEKKATQNRGDETQTFQLLGNGSRVNQFPGIIESKFFAFNFTEKSFGNFHIFLRRGIRFSLKRPQSRNV